MIDQSIFSRRVDDRIVKSYQSVYQTGRQRIDDPHELQERQAKKGGVWITTGDKTAVWM